MAGWTLIVEGRSDCEGMAEVPYRAKRLNHTTTHITLFSMSQKHLLFLVAHFNII